MLKGLYTAARQLREDGLWASMREAPTFVIRFSDGGLGYFVSAQKEDPDFMVVIGEKTWQRARLQKQFLIPPSRFHSLESFLACEMLVCEHSPLKQSEPEDRKRYEKAAKAEGFPVEADEMCPAFYFKNIGDTGMTRLDPLWQQPMLEALLALIHLAKRLVSGESLKAVGFDDAEACPLISVDRNGNCYSEPCMLPPKLEPMFEIYTITDQVQLARLRKAPRKGKWACDVVLLPLPVPAPKGRKDGEPLLVYPKALIVMETDNEGKVTVLQPHELDDAETVIGKMFVSFLQEQGVPKAIYVPNIRVQAMLSGIASQLCIPLITELTERQMQAFCSTQNDVFDEVIKMTEKSITGKMDMENELFDEEIDYFADDDDDGFYNMYKDMDKQPAGTVEIECRHCHRRFKPRGMTAHIKSAYVDEKPGRTLYYIFKIESVADRNYVLYADAIEGISLAVLDDYLRKTWVECCGHLSSFSTEVGEFSSYVDLDELEEGEEPNDLYIGIDEVMELGDKIYYTYDFGTPTILSVTLVHSYVAKKRKERMRTLARNVDPQWACIECGKPATQIGALRHPDEPVRECTYCADCARQKGDEPFLPLVNSPRTGLCGFTGELDDDE